MSDLPLRVAHQQTITGLLDMIPQEDLNPPSEDTSFAHLRWMMNHCMEHLFVWPIDKISRWIGCVQGVMRCRGVLDFGAERDRTRPIFHKAYEAMGYSIPKTAGRVTLDHPLAQRIDGLMQTGQDADVRLNQAINLVLAANPEQAKMFEYNRETSLSFLTGKVMQRLHGSADPSVIKKRLTELLDR